MVQAKCRGCKTNAYCYNNALYEMPFFVILMMIMHLEFYKNWSGKSGNFVVANE